MRRADSGHMQVHARFKPAQLFEPFDLLEAARRQCRTALQYARGKSVNPEVDVVGATVRNGRPGEVQRPTVGPCGHFDPLGLVSFRVQCRPHGGDDVASATAQSRTNGAQVARFREGFIALQIENGMVWTLEVEQSACFSTAVCAGRVFSGQDGFSAGRFNG